MAKKKVSVTLSHDRLRRVQELIPGMNVSEVVDEALDALLERELERQWLRGRQGGLKADKSDLPQGVPVDLSDVPWDDA